MAKRHSDLSAEEADSLNNALPVNQNVLLGSLLEKSSDPETSLFTVEKDITSDATGGLKIYDANAPIAFEVLDVIVQARVTSASATVTVDDGTTAITDAIVMTGDKNIARAGSIDDATSSIAKDGTLRVVTNGANDEGLVTIICKKK